MTDATNTRRNCVAAGSRLERLVSFLCAVKKDRARILLLLAFIGFISSLIWLAVVSGGSAADTVHVRLADMTVGHVVWLIIFVRLLFGR